MAIIVWICAQEDGWPFYLLMLLFALGLSIFGETEIDRTRSVVVRRWSLFKIIPLRQKQYAMSDFAFIRARFRDDQDGNRTWHVQLQKESGGRLEIKWFGYAQALPTEALNLQAQLSDITGLPIRNEIH